MIIEFGFDLDNLEKQIKNQMRLEDAFEIGFQKGLADLAERLEKKIIERLNVYGLGDSNLARSINVTIIGDSILLSATSDYVMFIEYGTGIRGQENPHPKANIDGWEYDVNEHGDEGWWYPTTMADPNPTKRINSNPKKRTNSNSTKRINSNGDIYAWTKGHMSRPFMYETWLYGRRVGTRIIRSYINKEIKALGGK